ncbi:AraC family transcriptional regulator [Actinoplanes sp. TFC3]|uniref:AraC family transcriptional regulator n=1 Tax=Actinoplanes sp. TFC3 TaxID=1710355 RepID=UPI0008329AAC|nr:AraC family transcriptional regulator [Actinoplanes sp. TFC3]
MDVLSEVLGALRAGRPKAMLLGWESPWAQEFAAVPGAMGFQVMLRGDCWLLPPGAEPVQLNEGEIVLRPRGRTHALATSPGARRATCDNTSAGPPPAPAGPMLALCGAYEVDPRLAHPLLPGLPEWRRVVPNEELRSVTGLLASEVARGGGSMVPALLETMLGYLLRQVLSDAAGISGLTDGSRAEGSRRDGSRMGGSVDSAVALALTAMHGDPERAWTVDDLAARSALSRSAFARRFSAATGRPPLAYLTWWRMTVAARRLRDSTDTVAVIAREAGYANEFAFTTAFRRHHGLPPGRFRRAAS